MFFLLANVLQRFQYLNVGLALVLVFVGVKMLLRDLYPIPITVSLGVVGALLGGAVLASLQRKDSPKLLTGPAGPERLTAAQVDPPAVGKPQRAASG